MDIESDINLLNKQPIKFNKEQKLQLKNRLNMKITKWDETML